MQLGIGWLQAVPKKPGWDRGLDNLANLQSNLNLNLD